MTLASALFLYDAIITSDREVGLFWTTKPSGASLLFLANKYISAIIYITNSAAIANFPSDEVSALAVYRTNNTLR